MNRPFQNTRRGSVVLEFLLMLPVLLLLFGVTLLTYDTLSGKLRLQQANRLFAWTTGDRYAKDKKKFDRQVVTAAKKPFADRNAIENALDASAGDMWGYGKNERMWAVNIERKNTGSGIFIGATPWALLAAGNMELEMKKVSGAYLGVLGVSSVVQANGEDVGKGIVASKFDLTHTLAGGDTASTDYSPESMVVRRFGNKHDYRIKHYRDRVWEIASEEWPRLAEEEPKPAGADDEPNVDEYARRLFDYAQ